MKKVLVISREYYPIANGTVTCLENIFPLLGEKCEVILYSCKEEKRTCKEERYKNVLIKRPDFWADNIIYYKRNFLKKLIYADYSLFRKKVVKQLIRVVFFPFQAIAKRWGYLDPKSWENNIVYFIEKNEKLEELDFLIAVGAPFENIRAAMKLKSKYCDILFIPILFDLYAYNPVLLREQQGEEFKKRLEEEYQWYQVSQKIVIAKEMRKTILNSILGEYDKKMLPLYFPSMKKIEVSKDRTVFLEQNAIQLVYAGAFYKDIRNPKFTMELIKRVIVLAEENDRKVIMHILGTGCEDIVMNYKRQLGESLILHGQCDKEYAYLLASNADILVNIGNKTTTQLPSKIFEYIGMCRPIINIYSVKEDICREYLENYPIKINIFEEEFVKDEIVERLWYFISTNAGVTCDEKEISQKYSEFTPNNFADALLKEIL